MWCHLSNCKCRFSADQREFLKDKSVVAIEFLGEKFEVVRQLAVSYEVDTLFGKVFEGIGRTVIWIGELVGELAEMRWCCATARGLIFKYGRFFF